MTGSSEWVRRKHVPHCQANSLPTQAWHTSYGAGRLGQARPTSPRTAARPGLDDRLRGGSSSVLRVDPLEKGIHLFFVV